MSMNPAIRESKDRGAAVARPDRAPAAGELPVEVDDEELDDAEPTAVEDGDGTPTPESAEENGGPPRTTDPVRLYLREAGAIQLLTREGEVEIAKRIEESNRLLVRAVLGTPHALHYVLALAEPLRAGERRTGRSAAELLRMTRGLARGGESGEPCRPERAALEHACRELRVPHETLVALAEEIRGTRRELAELEREFGMPVAALERAVRDIRAAELRARATKQELIQANLRLVVSIAKRYMNRGLQ